MDIQQFTRPFKSLKLQDPSAISKLDVIVDRSTFIDPEDQGHYWLMVATWVKELPVTDIVLIMKLFSQYENTHRSSKQLSLEDADLIIHALLRLAEEAKSNNVPLFNMIQTTLKLFIQQNDISLDTDDREEIVNLYEDYFK